MTKIQREWINALESGRFRQYAGGALRSPNGGSRYCCLGVACNIMAKGSRKSYDSYTIDKGLLSKKGREELGLSENLEEILIEMNDGKRIPNSRKFQDRHTFKSIAAYLRQCFK